MSIPSRLIVFIAQNIILFEHPIQISLWARMIRCDGKMKKIYVNNFDLRRVFTPLTWCMLCWCEWAIFLLRIDAESVWSSRFAVKSELVMILWNELAFLSLHSSQRLLFRQKYEPRRFCLLIYFVIIGMRTHFSHDRTWVRFQNG